MPNNENATINFGLFVIFLLIFVFGFWSGFAPLSSAVIAVGKVGTTDNKKIIQHLEGGVIDQIYVKDGDFVKAGDKLIKLSNLKLESELEIIKKDIILTEATISRLKAQIDNKNKIDFQDLNFNHFDNIKLEQELIFNEQQRLRESQREILNQKISQSNQQINALKAILNSKIDRLNSIKTEIKEWNKLYKEQLVDKIHIRNLEREKVVIDGEISANKSEILKINAQIIEINSQILFQDKSYKDELLRNLQDFNAKLIDLKERFRSLNEQLNRTEIKSPIDGFIIELMVNTIGGVVAPAQNLMGIIPNKDDFIIETKLQTSDIDSVSVGLLADIRFSAFNTNQSKSIDGEVIYVSADSLKDVNGFEYYEIKVKITKKGLQELKENNLFLLSGMPVEIAIKTSERTMLSYLLKPFLDMFKRAFNEE